MSIINNFPAGGASEDYIGGSTCIVSISTKGLDIGVDYYFITPDGMYKYNIEAWEQPLPKQIIVLKNSNFVLMPYTPSPPVPTAGDPVITMSGSIEVLINDDDKYIGVIHGDGEIFSETIPD